MYAPREIIVPVDFSDSSRAAAQRAAMIAEAFRTPLHLLHAVEYPALLKISDYSLPPGIPEAMRKEATEHLAKLESELAQGDIAITTEMPETDVISAIRACVERYSSNLIVMGTHGYTGLQHVFLGSIAECALRTLPCPTLTVKESGSDAQKPIRHILFATDFSTHSKHAAEVVRGIAGHFDAKVEILHVFVHPFGPYGVPAGPNTNNEFRDEASRLLDQCVAEFKEEGFGVGRRLMAGVPSEVIAHTAEQMDIDLLVMGTRGTTGLKHVFLGSNAERTLRAVHCSVLTAKEGDSL